MIKMKKSCINGWLVIKISQIKYYNNYYLLYLNDDYFEYMNLLREFLIFFLLSMYVINALSGLITYKDTMRSISLKIYAMLVD